MEGKHLAVFDFEGTVADGNTFRSVRSLLDQKTLDEVKRTHLPKGRTAYVREIFRLLATHGFDRGTLLSKIRQIQPTDGLKQLFELLVDHLSYDVIVVSDSVELFIVDWLAHNKLDSYVHCIYANSGKFDRRGVLQVEGNDAPLARCDADGEEHFCRGAFVTDFLKARMESDGVEYDRTIYVGDGRIDLCPIVKLTGKDLACVRDGRELHRIITEDNHSIQAEIVYWKTGEDIIKHFGDK